MALSLSDFTINDGGIAFICPSSCVKEHAQIVDAATWLEKAYRRSVTVASHCVHAEPAKMRAKSLLDLLLDDRQALLWCLRGGEGSADLIPYLLPHLDALKLVRPKVVIGNSDATALLLWLSQALTWPTCYGPSPLRVNTGWLEAETIQAMQSWLQSGQCSLPILDDCMPLNEFADMQTKTSGVLLGGNLSLLNISVADAWAPNLKDAFLFIEEVNEKPHAIMRTLKYLTRVGWFDKCTGLILGCCWQDDVTNITQLLNTQYNFSDRFLDWANTLSIPVYQSLSFGHGRAQRPLPYGLPVVCQNNKLTCGGSI